ncbi:hypothetical protein CRG98_029292 [Punica granatum]|uniref:UDP-rhamnose:rhamnosyltransferase 1 n=1 Tax=Punica granatum TaxID=22663 RepID=A0A2I0J264_PUNGR|nr:hypothetical protein CRG98_029292 [Punica granatum]
MARNLHVVMLPWSAFGHIIPFFHLSVSLARNGVHVTFVSTPRNIERLPKFPPDVSNSRLDLVKLPLPQLEGNPLPEGAEASVDIPFEKIQYQKVAFDGLKHPLEQLIISESPDWIIIDFVSHWMVEIARGIPIAYFCVFSAASNVFLGPPESLSNDGVKRLRPSSESLTVQPPWVDFPSSLALHGHESAHFYAGFYGDNASGISDACRVAKVLQSCDLVAFRSCMEYEGKYLKLYEKLIHKKVIPVGLLPPDRPEGLHFLWALRRPIWAAHEDEVLPDGFVERTCSRGIVCMGWVPQMEILAHPSIGASLFHAGWGSVIEILQFGHCLVILPLIIDQPLNARMLVERGLAIEVERRGDGSFTGNEISTALRLAMVSDEGRELRANARDAAKMFGNHELHQQYARKFVEYLKNNVRKKTLD